MEMWEKQTIIGIGVLDTSVGAEGMQEGVPGSAYEGGGWLYR